MNLDPVGSMWFTDDSGLLERLAPVIAGAMIALFLLVQTIAFLRRRRERVGVKLLEEFRETFHDGACPICSYHRFGVQSGYADGAPMTHDCSEA